MGPRLLGRVAGAFRDGRGAAGQLALSSWIHSRARSASDRSTMSCHEAGGAPRSGSNQPPATTAVSSSQRCIAPRARAASSADSSASRRVRAYSRSRSWKR
ncbi:hypothetical protein ABZZ04_10815 [Streptomyces sp. NPDC006435]|uniref:hypothetical protein n=1 Tax=Streptomyces sp. NPDC006435 TaxID=3154300 RepID=UPI0033B58CDE